ncbi:hypothetical protein C8F04DRAFT_1322654 [Mycena alexandri]|uniref:Uncharacterized protein n=1 Tax=Mycena alexandri TaxID=1745969 RepID=A0AAD6XFF9_9AGAR|nr:hypothetical protein C8F04DRAFT_1322654 [Mycena alexandri]
MVSRATSLEGLVILTPFDKSKICCRQNEDLRLEFRRLGYLSLKTIVQYGAPAEAARASKDIKALFNASAVDVTESEQSELDPRPDGDACERAIRIQRANMALTAPPPAQLTRLPLTTPIPGTASSSQRPTSSTRLRKRRLSDATPNSAPSKRRRASGLMS